MAYWDVFALTQDLDFQARSAACYASETAGQPEAINPAGWASEHIWQLAAAPGFATDYASAVAGGVQNPGRVEEVISDAELLSAVQAIL